MDWLEAIAPGIVLGIIGNEKTRKKFVKVLAKIYVKIHIVAQMDPSLQAEIDHQKKKEGTF